MSNMQQKLLNQENMISFKNTNLKNSIEKYLPKQKRSRTFSEFCSNLNTKILDGHACTHFYGNLLNKCQFQINNFYFWAQ